MVAISVRDLSMFSLSVRSRKHAEQLVETVQHQCHTIRTKLNIAWQDTNTRPKFTIYVGLAIVTILWLAVTVLHWLRNRKRQTSTRPSTPNLEKHSPFKATKRTPGGTTPHPHTSVPLLTLSLDTLLIHPAPCHPLPLLVHNIHRTPPLSPLPLWP
jgi:hypothetical protein